MSVIFIYSTYDDIWLIVVNLSVFLEKTINIPTQVISCSVALHCGIYEIITVRCYFAVTDDAPTWTKCFLFHWAYSGMHTIIIDENEYEHHAHAHICDCVTYGVTSAIKKYSSVFSLSKMQAIWPTVSTESVYINIQYYSIVNSSHGLIKCFWMHCHEWILNGSLDLLFLVGLHGFRNRKFHHK